MADITVIPKTPGESTRHWVYRCLLENIVDLTLPPGRVLGEQETGDVLGVSRTPLRDALFQLSQEHFVTIIPQSKTLVAKIRLDMVEEARYIRRCVEMDVIRSLDGRLEDEHLLALRYNLDRQELAHRKHDSELVYQLDEDLHRALFAMAGRLPIWESLQQRHLHFKRMRNLYHTKNKDTTHILRQHRALVAVLKAGDVREAEAIMDRHLSPGGWDMTPMRTEFPEYVE